MDCIILAGGFGTRLKKIVPTLPKPLALIRGKPFLELLLQQVASWKTIDRVVFSLGYKAKTIQEFVQSNNYPFETVFSIEEDPLGTGGATFKALDICQTDQVVVVNGDSYFDISCKGLYHAHVTNDADITIACLKVSDSSRYGSLEIDEHSGKITAFHEKSPQKKEGFINGGMYCIKKSAFEKVPFTGCFSMERDVFPFFLKRKLYGFLSSKTFIDIGTEKSYIEAQQILKTRIEQ